jgi:hypothetical protein
VARVEWSKQAVENVPYAVIINDLSDPRDMGKVIY